MLEMLNLEATELDFSKAKKLYLQLIWVNEMHTCLELCANLTYVITESMLCCRVWLIWNIDIYWNCVKPQIAHWWTSRVVYTVLLVSSLVLSFNCRLPRAGPKTNKTFSYLLLLVLMVV